MDKSPLEVALEATAVWGRGAIRYPDEIPLLEKFYADIVAAAQEHSRDDEVTIPVIDKYECLLVGEVTYRVPDRGGSDQ